MCVWMDKCLLRRNAEKKKQTLAIGRLFSSAIICLLAHKPLEEFFFKKSCSHFTLNYIGYWRLGQPPPCLRPLCNRTLLQVQQGLVELLRQFVCTNTSGRRGGKKKKEREEKKKNILLFHFGTFLLLSSITVTRKHNHTNKARRGWRKSARRMQ